MDDETTGAPIWPQGGGLMAGLIRRYDWGATSLGPVELWPATLKNAVDLMLASAQAAYIAWGPELISLYNEGYIPIAGTKHPQSLGQPYRLMWAEVSDWFKPVLDAIFAGESRHFVDQPIALLGRPDRPMSWFTFSWTPLRDDFGKVAGFYCAATETTDRILAEQSQHQSHRALVDAIDEGFCVIELIFDEAQHPIDYRVLETNAAFASQTGLHDVVGKRMRELAPEHEQFWYDVYGEIALTGEPKRFEHRADALDRWYNVYAFRVGDPEDHHVAVLFHNIASRKRAEEALKRSEQRFRALVTAGTYSIYRMSPDWRVMYQLDSDTLANTAGPIEDWVEKYIPETDLPAVRDAIDEAIRSKSLFELEHRVWLADGSVGWVISRAVPLLDEEGDIVEWFGAGSDVTERRLAQEKLREADDHYRRALELQVNERTEALERSRDLLQATMDSSPDMIQVFEAVRDEHGEIVDFLWVLNNHASERAYGQAEGDSLLKRNPGVIREGIFETFKQVTETGIADQSERHYVHEQFDGWFYQSVVKLGDGVATTTKDISDWKQAQAEVLRLQDEIARAKLQESEARLAAVFEALPVGVHVADLEGRTVLTNAELVRFLPNGVIPSRDHERGWRWRAWDEAGNLVPPADFPGARARRGETVKPGQEMLYTEDSGREVWTRVSATPVRDANGNVTGQVAVITDVDALKRNADALRESEERLRQFGEASQDILWIRDAATLQWVYLTPAFEAIYGISREQAMAGDNFKNWQSLIVPEDRQHAVTSIERVRLGERVTFEYRVRRVSDGAVRWLRNTDFPIRNEEGDVVLIGGIGHDFTEAREADLRLKTLVNGIPHLVWRAVDGGEWTWASPQWTECTGQKAPDYRNRGWLEPLHPDDRNIATEAWSQAVENGGFDVEYRIRCLAEGGYRWFQTRATPVRDRAGSIIEWLGTSTDIDELRRLQELQKTLMAELQHRVRNILAVTRSIIRRSDDGEREREDYVQHLDGRISALARTQVLLTRRAGVGVDLQDMIADELLAQTAAFDQFDLVGPDVQLSPRAAEILTLAIHELATNATKYGAFSRQSGRLSVTWQTEKRDGQDWLVLHWVETSVPIVESVPRRQGFGLELISQRIPYELKGHGTFELKPGGLQAKIEFPLLPASSILQTDGGPR